MKISGVLVILLVSVGFPAMIFSEGDFSGLSMDLGTDDTSLDNFLKSFTDDGLPGSMDGNYLDGDNDDFYPVPMPAGPSLHLGSRHVSSIADLLNLILGLAGHIVGRAGWVIRDGLGSVLRVGALVNPKLAAGLKVTSLLSSSMASGLKIASELRQAIDKRRNSRDGLLFSRYKLGNDEFSLSQRSKGYLRSPPSQRVNLFDTLRQRYTKSRR